MKADRNGTLVVVGEGKRLDRAVFVSLTLVVFCCFTPAGLGCLFFLLPVVPSMTMVVADCLLLSGRCGVAHRGRGIGTLEHIASPLIKVRHHTHVRT